MKSLWTIVSFLAVVHLLAIALFVGWLWSTQRLSRQRLDDLRSLFAMSVPESQAAAASAQAKQQAELQRLAQEAEKANPPLNTSGQIHYLNLLKQYEDQSRRRLEDERRMLLEHVAAAAAKVEGGKRELDRQRTAWEQAIQIDRKRKVDQQFLQAVKQYEQATPKQAKKMLMELVANNHADQAVAYLDAMSPRAAGKILREFKTDQEIALATELLEKLRTLGAPSASTPPAPTASNIYSPNANDLARAQ
jgi:hypothetical protein